MEERINLLEKQSKKNNIRINGIPSVGDSEDTKKVTIDNIKEHLDISIKTDDIEECFRITNKDNKEQPILVKFRDNYRRNKVFKAKG